MGDYFRYYAGLADKVQSAVIPTDKKGVFAYTQYEPKGVVAIITPWNSPLTLTSWKLAPALAAGCTAVIKPSEFTSASMLEFATLFAEAGFPNGVVNVVTGLGPEVGAALVAHPAIAHIGFTGGDAAGRKIYELAARGLKTVTLELGGKSPNIVFDDADLEQAVKGVVSGIFAASGQSCQAGSRLLVQRAIHDVFSKSSSRSCGRPSWAIPRCPTRRSVRSRRGRSSRRFSTTSRSRRPKARAAFSAAGAGSDLGAGMFIEPTIFTDVKNSMRIAQEEVFGPVLAVIPFEDEADAIAIGNDVVYGLAGGGVDEEPPPRDAHDRQAQGRHGVGQQLPRDELHVAVRRLQEVGHRPRVGRRNDQGVPVDEVRLDFHAISTCPIRSSAAGRRAIRRRATRERDSDEPGALRRNPRPRSRPTCWRPRLLRLPAGPARRGDHQGRGSRDAAIWPASSAPMRPSTSGRWAHRSSPRTAARSPSPSI